MIHIKFFFLVHHSLLYLTTHSPDTWVDPQPIVNSNLLIFLRWSTIPPIRTRRVPLNLGEKSALEAPAASRDTTRPRKALRRLSIRMGGFSPETLQWFCPTEASRSSIERRISSSWPRESTLPPRRSKTFTPLCQVLQTPSCMETQTSPIW